MELKSFKNRLENVKQKNQGFTFTLNDGVNASDIDRLEQQIGRVIPESVKKFWMYSDGLETENPGLKIYSIKDFKITNNSLIHFTTFDKKSKIYFNISELNTAQEWSIVNIEEDYTMTLTMSSFWSNKIWHWLDYQAQIWKDEYWLK